MRLRHKIAALVCVMFLASRMYGAEKPYQLYDRTGNISKLNLTSTIDDIYVNLSAVMDNYSDQSIAGNKSFTGTTTIAQPTWTAPSLQNNWVNYGLGTNPAGYFKDSMGIVHLRGLVKSGTVGQVIFTLPAGYRPTYNCIFVAISHTGAAVAIGRLDVAANGNVSAVEGSNAYFSLDGITFATW